MPGRALALDLGTSSVRALVFEKAGPGQVRAVPGALARRPRQLRRQVAGQATFVADEYLADLVACIDELAAQGALEGVSEVAADCQWHSVMALDAGDQPISELVTWSDTRPRRPQGLAQPDEGQQEELRQRTGCALAPLYWTWRAPWLAEMVGGATVARYVGLADYVTIRLLEQPTMSVSMASGTGLLSTSELDWDDEALELAGVTAAQLPALAPRSWRGRLGASWRARWPALADAAWHPVMGDGAAANLGVGCHVDGRAALTVGTSAAVRAARAAPDRARLPAGLWRYCIDHDRVVVGAAYSSGGQVYAWALSWWQGGAGSPADGRAGPDLHYDLTVPVAAGSDGVLVLPWHAGTRPPAAAVVAGQGCVVGLGLGHSTAHLVSAAVEGVCFQLAGGLDDLEAGRDRPLDVVANGGAVERSPFWRGRLAAALGRPLRCATVAETTAKGAAANALGVYLEVDEADVTLVEPVGTDVAALAAARRRWGDWYARALPIVRASAG
jgi:gluconokinase